MVDVCQISTGNPLPYLVPFYIKSANKGKSVNNAVNGRFYYMMYCKEREKERKWDYGMDIFHILGVQVISLFISEK